MRMSLHADYALRTLMYLAVHDGHRSIGEIAQAYGISKNHLMKVAQRLVAEGFLEAVRGRSGGLRLAQAATQINVGQVARKMEETGSFVECFDPATNSCVITPACRLRHALAGALEAFFRHLDRYSLGDLVKDPLALQESLL
ncbi:MAG: RrF2 family transcriptional regulator [Blastomonas fulva]|uniref:Rrf2 family transcriptional regulator n=2 Tax=Alphaproteobacteria TaxID=28211 RepID=A0ABN5BC94_9SPHN|nr:MULTISPECIES: Rrf2 family transcriptional regulator [Blastomonas]ASR52440.1 Rrf2 family transcriptional regulator [Blastomonas fulva]KPF73868.1 Rrf2 family transcriptional regulator [Blastomonas sp. AAP25]MCO5792046.1 Rrf2 family transcriptional regulator [Blastomonas sp.]